MSKHHTCIGSLHLASSIPVRFICVMCIVDPIKIACNGLEDSADAIHIKNVNHPRNPNSNTIEFLFNEEKKLQNHLQKSVVSVGYNSATASLHQAAKLGSHYRLYEYWIGALCPYSKCIQARRTGLLLFTQEHQHNWSVFVFYHSCKCQNVIYLNDIYETFHLPSKWTFRWSQVHLYKCKVTCSTYSFSFW